MSDWPMIDESRRSSLLGVKLRALVSEHVGGAVQAELEEVPHGAALMHGDAAWMIIDGQAAQSLGSALAWAVRRGASSLDVVAEAGGGTLARRATAFSLPITAWFPHERTLLPTVAEPLVAPPVPRAEHLVWTQVIADAGAVPNVEHGVVFGEVRGLEVCRVVDQPTVGFFTEPGGASPGADMTARPTEVGLCLEVGVGAADREAFQMLHGAMPTPEALAAVVDAVLRHRSVDSPHHPLNRLGRERFLRWQAEQTPEIVDVVELVAAEPPLPRPNLKDPIPCLGRGTDAHGSHVQVVFSSGVDVDLVPYVADVQASADTPVVVALPARDILSVTREVADLLVVPFDFIALD